MEYTPSYRDDLYLAHHGIKGQRWGVRRYQNPDGSLTPRGKKRYAKSIGYIDYAKQVTKDARDALNEDYALAQNNYIATRDIKKKLIDSGAHTNETFNKMYPNWDIGTNYDKRRAKFMRDKINQIDVLNKKINDIDVTAQSYRKTKKLVDDLFAKSTVKMDKINNEYDNSHEVKEYQDMLNRMRKVSRKQTQEIVNKYRL